MEEQFQLRCGEKEEMRKFYSLDRIPKGLKPIKDTVAFLLDPMLYPKGVIEYIVRDVEYIEIHFDMLWRPHATVYMKYRKAMGLSPDEISKSPYKILDIGAMSDNLYRVVGGGLSEEVSSTKEGYFYFKLVHEK